MSLYKCPVTRLRFDPLRCARRLQIESGNKINEWIINRTFETDEALISVIRRVFELPAYDRNTYDGYTDEQVLSVLDNFTEWLSKKG